MPAIRTRTSTSHGLTVGTGTSSRTMPRLAGSLTTASMRAWLEGTSVPLALQRPRRLAREVGDDQVRTGPTDRGQRLQHAPLLVEPAEASGRLDHRVLARHRVCSQRETEL